MTSPTFATMTITYEDKFDIDNYPIADFHHDRLTYVNYVLFIPANQRRWSHIATSHGRIFTLRTEESLRLTTQMLRRLSRMPNLRWISLHADRIEIALTHIEADKL